MNIKKFIYFILPVLSILTIVMFFFVMSSQEGSMIPSPPEIARKFISMMTIPISRATLEVHVWVSLKRVLSAFFVAIGLGIALGVALGWSTTFNNLVSPVFEVLRPIPPIAWIPMAILWFGLGEMSKIFIVFVGAFIPIVINTHSGINMTDPLLINAGKVIGANRRQLLINVVFPASIPAILAGIKTALSTGWMCVLAAEMIAARQGVGFLILNGQEMGDMALIVVCMFVIGGVSAFLSFSLTQLQGVLCPWQFKKAK